MAILAPHLVLLSRDQVVSLASRRIDELLSVGWITNTLEELDTLLTLELLQLSILLDEILLIYRQLDTLQVVQN